ncbi:MULTISPECIES: hypothetical protein [Halobellus]|uniref:hypothetical protein n=1 Tax=Halobellus TaxID=1073986 RepID=UPI0021147243|nr:MULTISPECIES: hypothetical protein [Halobellus]MDQ2054747.1 hypothetical protein [Halobellus sp. H-GB7]
MSITRPSGFEEVCDVLATAEEPLTAREILDHLRARGVDGFETSYRVATVLGRAAERGAAVTVIDGSPYRYRLDEPSR